MLHLTMKYFCATAVVCSLLVLASLPVSANFLGDELSLGAADGVSARRLVIETEEAEYCTLLLQTLPFTDVFVNLVAQSGVVGLTPDVIQGVFAKHSYAILSLGCHYSPLLRVYAKHAAAAYKGVGVKDLPVITAAEAKPMIDEMRMGLAKSINQIPGIDGLNMPQCPDMSQVTIVSSAGGENVDLSKLPEEELSKLAAGKSMGDLAAVSPKITMKEELKEEFKKKFLLDLTALADKIALISKKERYELKTQLDKDLMGTLLNTLVRFTKSMVSEKADFAVESFLVFCHMADEASKADSESINLNSPMAAPISGMMLKFFLSDAHFGTMMNSLSYSFGKASSYMEPEQDMGPQKIYKASFGGGSASFSDEDKKAMSYLSVMRLNKNPLYVAGAANDTVYVRVLDSATAAAESSVVTKGIQDEVMAGAGEHTKVERGDVAMSMVTQDKLSDAEKLALPSTFQGYPAVADGDIDAGAGSFAPAGYTTFGAVSLALVVAVLLL
eukprot:GHVQ01013249.1.p1 GENE.GHVQ01013249.1~~GHVQ01013249.1.p1  ORF type:complete len:500 (-),score=95.50 GHVQ01013249.1:175-1674(-)